MDWTGSDDALLSRHVRELVTDKKRVIVASYAGQGKLAHAGGRQTDCEFVVLQLNTGDVLLFCTGEFKVNEVILNMGPPLGAHGFEGRSGDMLISTDGKPGEATVTACSLLGDVLAFQVPKVRIERTAIEAAFPCELQFTVTNFTLFGDATQQPFSVELDLEALGRRTVAVAPLPGYDLARRRLRVIREPQITCALSVPIASLTEIKQAEVCVSDLCILLSLAQGSHVSWIGWQLPVGSLGAWKTRLLANKVAGPWSPFRLVDVDIPSYLRQTYPVYLSRREDYELNRGTILAYVTAKHEADYLENRGAKLALALERLHSVFSRKGASTSRILPTNEFRKLGKKLEAVIEQDVASQNRELLSRNLHGLNRRSFRHSVVRVLAEVGACGLEQDVPHFVESRDCLVHKGDFWCEVAPNGRRAGPFTDRMEEYRFMLHFMDRLLLKIVGYSGLYVDARKDARTYELLP